MTEETKTSFVAISKIDFLCIILNLRANVSNEIIYHCRLNLYIVLTIRQNLPIELTTWG